MRRAFPPGGGAAAPVYSAAAVALPGMPACRRAGIGATFPAFPTSMSDPYRARLLARIEELAAEHGELERVLEAVLAEPMVDEIRVRRLKKRKLLLKDQIALLRRELDPDVSA